MFGCDVISIRWVIIQVSMQEWWLCSPRQAARSPAVATATPSVNANLHSTGCWASSGYSVQGCAQLEQKLRQCMDAPVSPTHHNTNYNVSDISSATRTKRRTRSITTSRECTPRLSALISETRRDHPPVYYLLGTTHAHGRSLHRAGVWGGTLAFVHVQVERDWTCKQRH